MRRAVIVLLSITAALAADKKALFKVEAASAYPGAVTQEKVTIAAKPYNTDELAATAFDKKKPHERGILPVLVVIQNGTGRALRINLKTEFVTPEREQVEPLTPDEVTRFQGVQKRPDTGARSPIPLPIGKKKGPLNTPEIEGRAFAVKLLPPGESAHGFVYFQASDVKGAQLLVTGISDAATGQAHFYFEVPLDAK